MPLTDDRRGEHHDDDSLSLTGWGKTISAKGTLTIVVSVLAVALFFICWMFYNLSTKAIDAGNVQVLAQIKSNEMFGQQNAAIMNSLVKLNTEHVELTEQVGKVNENVEVQNTILLSTDEQKQRIKSVMRLPKSLRELFDADRIDRIRRKEDKRNE